MDEIESLLVTGQAEARIEELVEDYAQVRKEADATYKTATAGKSNTAKDRAAAQIQTAYELGIISDDERVRLNTHVLSRIP